MIRRFGLIPAAVVLGVAFIIGVVIFTHTWHSNYELNQTISVTGSAVQTFTSDIGYLRVELEARAPKSQQAYKKLQAEKPIVVNFLRKNGFKIDDIHFDTPNSFSQQQYDKNGRPTGRIISWKYNQQVSVQSNDVQKIKALSLKMNALVNRGVTLHVRPPNYYYSGLDSLKVNIQARAAQNAKKRAEKISKATGQKLGKMRSARMGVLQITPVNSTSVSSMGIHNVSTIKKQITGVVSATFQIK
jgi:hypothetical protein